MTDTVIEQIVRRAFREQVRALAPASFLAGNELAASGKAARVRNFANFDQIVTHHTHRRRGLASALMHGLGEAVEKDGAKRGVLVATEQGQHLYAALGWTLHSPYVTVGLPG
jgi:predicted GNAT family acetyltransferase